MSHKKIFAMCGISALIGVLVGFSLLYNVRSDVVGKFPAKGRVSQEISAYLLRIHPDFMAATDNKLLLFPFYMKEGNCLLVRPEKSIAYNEPDEFIFCFDSNWNGPPKKVAGFRMAQSQPSQISSPSAP
jgi:hypothetical protein